MRRFLLTSALVVAATLIACDEDPMAPPTTGSLSLRIVVGEASVSQQTVTAAAASFDSSTVAASRVVSDPRRGEAPRVSAYDGTRTGAAAAAQSTAAAQAEAAGEPSAAPASSTAIDAATILIRGPKDTTLTGRTPGNQVTVENLPEGTYTVVLLGLVGGASGQVDYFGQTSATVNPGSNTTATIAFNSFRPVIQALSSPTTDMAFTLSWNAVPGASQYYVELSSDAGFSSPASGTVNTPAAVATVSATGTWYVRASAVNQWVTRGRASDVRSVDIVTDIDPSGDSFGAAYDLGFGAAAGVVYSRLNVVPTSDEDWYSLEACLGDTLIAETFAQRLDPPSDLDTYLELFGPSGDPIEAQDDNIGTDSRIERILSSGGTYYVKVSSYQASSTGNYELAVSVGAGAANTGTACTLLPGATNGWTGASQSDPTNWSDPENWFTGVVPGPTDTVSIPANATPVLTENVEVAGLTIGANSHLETNGWTLTVTGDLAAGNSITGSGTVHLTGSGVSLSGGLPNLYVYGDVSLSGQAYATGDVMVYGALRMNGHGLAVGGAFRTLGGSGLLVMQSEADTLAVAGYVGFDGAPTSGQITAGRIISSANFDAVTGTAAFAPSGTNRVVMAGTANRLIKDVAGSSHFNHLSIQTNATITIGGSQGHMLVGGQLGSTSSVTPTVTGGALLVGGVAVQNMVLENAALVVGNGTITTLDGVTFRNFPASTPQLTISRAGGSYTFNKLTFSQANGASDIYVVAADTNASDNNQLRITLAGATPVDGTPGITSVTGGAVVNWVPAQVGAPAQVAFTVQPTTAAAGTAIAPAIQVAVQDANTITVPTYTGNVTVALNDNPAGGTLSGTKTVAAVAGVATFSNLSIDKAATGYTLIASAPGLATSVSRAFGVTAGAATTIAMRSGDLQAAAPSATLRDSLAVKVTDTYGNGVTGVSVTWAAPSGGSVSPSTSTTNAQGIAKAAFTLGATLGTYAVQASAAELTGSPVTFTATASNIVTWLNAVSGNWSNGANWSGGSAPGASDAAAIVVPGTYTVTVDGDVNVESFLIGGGASRPTVTANGRTMAATGIVNVDSNAVLNITSSTLNAATVINRGSLIVNASTINAAIENRSQLRADGSTTLNGAFTAAAGSMLRLDGSGADVTVTNGFTNNGTIYFTSAESAGYPSLYVDTGWLVNAVGGKIRFAGVGGGYLSADLDNRDSLKVESGGAVELVGASLANSGVMYAATADLSVNGALWNTGTIAIADGRTFGSYGAGLGNAASGQIVMGTDATLDLSNTATTFDAGYTVRATRNLWIDGSGETDPSVTFAGVLTVEAGGTVDVLSNTVTVDSLVNSGDFSLHEAHLVGPVDNTGAFYATVGGNSVTGSFYSATDAWVEVAEPGTELVVTGNLTNHGTLKLYSTTAGTAPKLQVTGGTLTHHQWFDSDGPAGGLVVVDSLDNQGEMHAVSGGTFTVEGPAINSGGSVYLTDADFVVTGTGLFTNAGGITINNGRKFVRSGGTFQNPGQIFGNGTLDVLATNFTSTGAINPGLSPGTLNFDGNVTLVSGDLYIDLDGTAAGEYDVMNVSGAAALAGVLAVTQNITPAAGDTFTVMTFGSRNGTQFTSLEGLAIDADFTLSPVYSDTNLMLVVAEATDSVVVAPNSASLTGVGAQVQLTAQAYGGDAPLSDKNYVWSSLNPNVATVAQTGLVTAVASGQAIIRAQVDGVSGYALVTVAVTGAPAVNLWRQATSGTTEPLLGVWGTSPNNVYVVGGTGKILRYDGSTWSSMTSGTSQYLNDVWGTATNDIYAVGNGTTVLWFTGASWSAVTGLPTAQYQDVWGTSPTDIFAVGAGGFIGHYDGTDFQTMTSGTTEDMRGVWGTSRSNVYAVGQVANVLRYDGTAWSSAYSGTPLRDVWGAADTSVFAVGDGGTIVHYNGTAWGPMTSGTGQSLSAVWGTSPTEVFAVGTSGAIVRYNGSSWSTMTSGTTEQLIGVWGTTAGSVWAVGGNGMILRGYRGATVTVTPNPGTIAAVGGTVQLTAAAQDAGSSPITGVTFTWSSSDSSKAIPNASGLVTAMGIGTATITARAPGGASGSATVTVRGVASAATSQITASPTSIVANGASTSTITVQLRDQNNSNLTMGGDTVTLATTLGSLGAVTDNNNGTYTATLTSATTVGTATVTGTVNAVAITDNATVSFTPGPAAALSVTGIPDPITAGTLANVTVTARDAYGNVATGYRGTVTFTSNDPSATLPTNYAFVAADAGVHTFTSGVRLVTAGERSVTATDVSVGTITGSQTAITVNAAAAATVTVTPTGATITTSGGIRTYGAVARDVYNNVLPSPNFTWTSLHTGVATINSTGTATAVAAGQATIRAVSGSATGYAVVTVAFAGSQPVSVWDTVTTAQVYNWGTWGRSATDVYSTGQKLFRWNGSSWLDRTPVSTTNWQMNIWGATATDLWTVGGNHEIGRFDGTNWTYNTAIGGTGYFYGIWGAAPNDIHAVGDGGVLAHYNGTAWSSMTNPAGTVAMSGLWGVSSDTVYASGANCTLLVYRGSSWTQIPTGACTQKLYRIWGTSGRNVYIVGAEGLVLHYNGTSIDTIPTGVANYLYGIWGTSATEIFVFGSEGLIMAYNGSSWTRMPAGVNSNLLGVWGSSSGDFFGGSVNGILRGYRGRTKSNVGNDVSLGSAFSFMADYMFAWGPHTMGSTFEATEIGAITYGAGGQSRFAIYSDAGGYPGTKLAETAIISVPAAGTYLATLDNRYRLPAGAQYWIVSNQNATTPTSGTTATGPSYCYTVYSFSSGLPATFPAGGSCFSPRNVNYYLRGYVVP